MNESTSDLLDMCQEDGVQLRRSGKAYVAKCPFHHDRKASFQISLSNRGYWVFKCWSTACGVKGGARKYRELTNRPPPPEVEKPTKQTAPRYDKPTPEILDLVANHYADTLPEHDEALKYLSQRGIDKETAISWRIGYAPGDTAYRLLAARMTPEELEKCPLVRHYRKDDRFARRLILSQLLPDGSRGWLTARAIDPDREPKYLHLPGARPALMRIADMPGKHAKYQVITEGPFDAMAVMLAGFPAQCTNGNPYERRLAQAISDQKLSKVFILPDRDAGGEGWAALVGRASMLASVPAVLLELPDWANDPGDLLNSSDEQAPAKAVATAIRIGLVRHPDGWNPPETEQENRQSRQQEYAEMPFPNGDPIFIMGNLTKDPEIQTTRNGGDMTKFGVATNYSVWSSEEQGYVDAATFYQCTAFGSLGNQVYDKLRKGDFIVCWGSMTVRKYQGRDGSEQISHDVNVAGADLYLARTRRDDDGGQGNNDRDYGDQGNQRSGYDRPRPPSQNDRGRRDDRDRNSNRDRRGNRDQRNDDRDRRDDREDPRGNWSPPPQDPDELPF